MDNKKYGGVGAKEVIVFQTKIMMGAQFGRIVWAREHKTETLSSRQNEILIACLRMGWNDAFRHTSKNEEGINDTKGKRGKVSIYEKKSKYKKSWLKLLRGKIREELFPMEFDDYFSDRVLSSEGFLDIFKAYATTYDEKSKVIDSAWKNIEDSFRGVKRLDGNQKLSFGHIQKMFNIAIKLYLCLFICREELDLEEALFVQAIVDHFDHADCPIDSIILGELEQMEMEDCGIGVSYSPVYTTYTWSQLESDGYDEIQKGIQSRCHGNSNLWFDFQNWN